MARASDVLDVLCRSLLWLTLSPAAALAQGAGEAADSQPTGLVPGRPSVSPTRITAPPRIDGRLDDVAWTTAARLTTFVQQRPLEAEPATEDTTVWVAYDDDHLYFAFDVRYAEPSIMRANKVDRDQAFEDDLMTIYLDTFLDQQRAYDFDVNGYGVQGDGVTESGGGGIPDVDRSWDALFDTGAQIVAHGYTAEMAIPFKSLRYPRRDSGEPHRWGLQIVREIKGKNEENAVWAPMSRDESSFYRQMGLLEGMTNLSTSRNLEILPTFTAVQFGSIDESNGAFATRDPNADAGLNIKYGVTSNLTADFTLNPDFSQVESDEPQIEANQRFALFYPELRPFFLEGASIFSIRGPVTFVHTRTIVDPQYGVKMTGKQGRTALGVLFAEDEAPGNLDDPADPAFGREARTFIGRATYDLYSGSHLGGLVTNRDFLTGYSRLGLLDGNFRLGATHNLGFRVAGTANRAPDGAVNTGHLIDVDFRKNGRNLSYFWANFALSPDFETEAGFVRRTDQRSSFGNIEYQWWPEHWIINWGPRFEYGRTYDYDGVLQDENVEVSGDVQFARNIEIDGGVSRNMERFGGIDFEKTRYFFGGDINTSRRYEIGVNVNGGDEIFYDEEAPFLGREAGLGLNLTLRPVSSLQARFSLDTSRFVDTAGGDREMFDIKVLRAQITYQATRELAFRNISQWDTYDKTFDLNLLATYRVNAGTVFYAGYDDHHRQGDHIQGDPDRDGIDQPLFSTTRLRRTNRAVFVKLQYLFRY
jgi:hypothetical protein